MKSQIYLAQCLERFYELPELIILEFDNPKYLQVVKDLNNKYGLQLSFTVILVAIGELYPENLAEYLIKRHKLPETSATDIATQLNTLYFKPITERLAFLNPDNNKTKPSIEEEETTIINLLKENLIVELKNKEAIIAAINQRIFAWFSRKKTAQKQAENALLQNQERITEQSVIINNEKLPGTTTNWLRCFAIEKGADNFNSLSISEFSSLSKNTKDLPEEDKKVLRALLNTYRNIKFFPDSMPSDDGSDWAIIPIPEKTISLDDSIDITTAEPADKIIDPEMQATNIPLPPNIESETTSISSENVNKINQLQLMLKRYGSDSLEAQAILEEIDKLKNR